jgi:hypothetical protein
LAGIDILFNILLFVPFGIGLRLSGSSRMSGVAIAAALSAVVELLQLGVVTGRDGSVRDLLMNTLGALIGVALADGWKRLVFPSQAEARRLVPLAAACWFLLAAGEAALLGRAFLPTIWYGQWAPEGVFPATFTGRVLDVRLGSLELPEGRLDSSGDVRAAMLQDQWTLLVKATTGDPTRDVSSVFSIFDGEQREMLVVGQEGTDLFVRYRTRAAALHLRSPSIVLPGALALPAGEPIQISVSFARGVISVTARSSARTDSRQAPATPSWGWSLVAPFDASIGSLAPLWSALWMAALLIPTGYWAGRGMGTLQVVILGVLVLLLGTGLTPFLFQLPPAGWNDWMAGAAGLAAGGLIGKASRGR